MEKVCKNCKYWERSKMAYEPIHSGRCSSEKFVYTGDGEELPKDGLGYSDLESYSASFMTGKHFGCIHWIAK